MNLSKYFTEYDESEVNRILKSDNPRKYIRRLTAPGGKHYFRVCNKRNIIIARSEMVKVKTDRDKLYFSFMSHIPAIQEKLF